MPACQKDLNVSGFADRCTELEALALAPCDLEPLGPMLASTPAFAMGDSEATYASAALDCANAPAARLTRVARRVTRIVPCGQTGVGEEGRRRLRTSDETLQDQGTSSAIFIPLAVTATERMPAVAVMTKRSSSQMMRRARAVRRTCCIWKAGRGIASGGRAWLPGWARRPKDEE